MDKLTSLLMICPSKSWSFSKARDEVNETAGGVVKNVECKVKLGKNGGEKHGIYGKLRNDWNDLERRLMSGVALF